MNRFIRALVLLAWVGCTGEVALPDGAMRDGGSRDAAIRVRDGGGTSDSGGMIRDAAGIDATVALDALVGDPCATRLFCDDFEGHSLGDAPGAPWSSNTNGASIEIDDTHRVSGTRAVRFTTEGGAGTFRRAYVSLTGAPVFPGAAEVMYGRVRVWLDHTPSGSVHWTNIQGEGDVPGMSFRALSRYGGQHSGRIMANYETNGVSTDCWDHSTTVMPSGAWTCLEWRFEGDTDRMDLWVDGTLLSDVAITGMGEGCGGHDTGDRWYGPVYDTIRLGWEHYQATESITMWMDDVAIDDERIGCD